MAKRRPNKEGGNMKNSTNWIVALCAVCLLSVSGKVMAELRKPELIDLNGTTWEISMRAATEQRGAHAEKDTLIFNNRRFISKNFEAQGYTPTGYTVRLRDDGSTRWETMQTKEEEGHVFWRADIDPETMQMRGVLRKLSEKGKVQDFNFVSSGVNK
jgi:hypothetical protein